MRDLKILNDLGLYIILLLYCSNINIKTNDMA